MYSELVAHLRGMQFFSHNAHNMVARSPFHSDHDFFGEVYTALEDDYDSVIERMLGLFGDSSINFDDILSKAHFLVSQLDVQKATENVVFYQHLLILEKKLCDMIKQICLQNCSIGTEQLLGDIANKSEMRQYKISRRIKK